MTSSELKVDVTVPSGDNGLELTTWQFAKYPIWVVGLRKTRWAKDRTATLTALCDEPLLLLAEDFFLMRRPRQAFLEARIESHIAARNGHWEFLVSMVTTGLGMTFSSQLLVANLANRDRLAVARLTAPDMDQVLAHLWSPGRYLSHTART